MSIFNGTLLNVAQWDPKLQILTLLLSPFLFTWIWTTVRCSVTLRKQTPGSKAPTMPYAVPVLSHTLAFAADTANFLKRARERFGSVPVRFHVGTDVFTFVPHGESVTALFKNSRDLHAKRVALEAMEHSFGMPHADVERVEADNSGVAAEPAPGFEPDVWDPSKRFFYQVHRDMQQQLQGGPLNVMTAHFLEKYAARVQAKLEDEGIGLGEWVEYEDLYAFMRDDLFCAAVQALCGERIFQVAPTFCEDFWAFDGHLSTIFKRLPRWLAPKAWASRDRLLDHVRRWHADARAHFDWEDDEAVNAPWEPVYGARMIRSRQQMYRRLGQSDDGNAAMDVGMIWATNANVIPSAFWTLLGVLKSASLPGRVLAETSPAFEPGSLRCDIAKLCAGNLMMSMYMESLRHVVAVSIVRSPTVSDYRIGPWSFGKSDTLMAMAWYGAHDTSFWNTGRLSSDGKPEHPLDSWWAERFLEYADDAASGPIRKPDPDRYRHDASSEKRATEKTAEDDQHAKLVTTGIQGHWFPYGGGIKMCPGRFFAKQEMMAGVALMLRAFEFELVDLGKADKVRPDMAYFPFGAMPPDRKVPFRVRRRKF
ncbi:cytochrome P450 [Xylariaceae sp. FL0016]|nr:cytochrome P450 [Xylariaceae sp. FL0016]